MSASSPDGQPLQAVVFEVNVFALLVDSQSGETGPDIGRMNDSGQAPIFAM